MHFLKAPFVMERKENFEISTSTLHELPTLRSASELFPHPDRTHTAKHREGCLAIQAWSANFSKLLKILSSTPGCPEDGLKLKGLHCLISVGQRCVARRKSVCCYCISQRYKNKKPGCPFRSIRAFGLDLSVCRLGVIHLRQEVETSGCGYHYSNMRL